SRFGPGQGSAHDLAVGILIDEKGDDSYTISGGQGMALTNSVAIFIDGAGNDCYMTSERGLGQGGVRPARDFGNVGLFIDMEGRDRYPDPLIQRDSVFWFEPYWGIGTDVPLDIVTPEEAPVEVEFSAQDTMRSIEEIFKEAALWEVVENRARVKRARKALGAKGIPAVEWVVQNKLATRDGLEMRAIIELFKEFPDAVTPYLLQALQDTTLQKRKNVAKLLGELKRKDAVPMMLQCLADDDYEKARNAILDGLGDIGDSSATSAIVPHLRATAERRRIAATVALGKIGDVRAIPYLFERLDDSFFTVRSAAMYGLAKFGKEILTPLEAQFRTSDARKLEQLLLLTGDIARNWKAKESEPDAPFAKRLQPLAGRYLEHPSPRVRSAALVATAPFLNRKSILQLEKEFEQETDPLILARWRAVRREFVMP
ncbi:MAG: HEAT repeat domain-containing protein, partial [Calditrichaeota bacterium]|nr:HEAT repeat domain-containing protein [Calditrichota bacterium]